MAHIWEKHRVSSQIGSVWTLQKLKVIVYFSWIPLLVVEPFLEKQFKIESQYENILRGGNFSEEGDS